ncbi:AAA family ATPase [Mitsuaria sp. GD03876]|uniref:AAA family ATPase n=1 Tax=Mitsuaria sp. GD03876 TaxID=2975399 RepID=UPI0024470D1C|nr:AAA family ATPase [Mitsuaria sp. GD03876]MDH0865486.1 AAA family ATPase [Mitsuaria sp. GD03876]
MRLKSVTLSNFRCFDRLEVNFHSRLTVFVGINGAGKTALLDAIAAGLTPVLRHLSSANQRLSTEGAGLKDSDFKLVNRGNDRWTVADYAQVIVKTDDDLEWDYWRAASSGKVPELRPEGGKLAAVMKEISESKSGSTPRLMPVFAYYGAQRGRIVVPERLRQTKEKYDHPTSALVGALDSLSDFKEMLKWFDLAETSELRTNKGRPETDFARSPALEAVRQTIVRLLGDQYKNPYFNSDHRFVVEKTETNAPMQVMQLSQGYQSMLALAMDFARRLSLGNPHLTEADREHLAPANSEPIAPLAGAANVLPALLAPAIMLVDELDLHLHPTWQQRVLGDLMAAFPNTQFIVTTHSPQILTTVPDECIRVIDGGQLFSAPPGTQGAEPARLLKQVLGVPELRPDLAITRDLKEYLALVDEDKWATPRALELRRILDDNFKGHEPDLIDADLRIDNRRWELGE